ncbi:SPFH domain-containing protein [Actinomadura sp. GTD37]|uniref:SPFH domain-containing protein n=1 Tax=Actinomadura sp. GTD37 TaxID=1778030 RepID=UPI0035C057F5
MIGPRIVKQYEQGVLFRLGRVRGVREPGLRLIIPVVDVMRRVTLRIVTMPIQSQGIITRDNVSVDVSAVAYYRVADAVKSVVAIENVRAAIDQIAQTTLRKVVGQHTLDPTLSETDRINADIREILDVTTSTRPSPSAMRPWQALKEISHARIPHSRHSTDHLH